MAKQIGKTELEAEARRKFGMTTKQANEVVTWFFDTIADQVVGGGNVTIKGFGTFKPRHAPARSGSHPKTGIPFVSAPKTTMHFTVAGPLAERLNGK